jgi:CHASE2 domain-containing sensor protein
MNHANFLRQVLKDAWSLVSTRPKSIANLKARWQDFKHLILSWAAMVSRQLGLRAILIIGLGASAYAGFMYFAGQIAPSSTSASHDAVLKARWASPKPSLNIVIVDIDERSLAALAPEHGRWPWPRAVLADGLDRMSQAGVRAVLMNVMLSDPDKNNPDSDAAMEMTAAMTPNIAYPLIRLNPVNDTKSQLRVSDLLAKTGDPMVGSPSTVAMILPMFGPMLDRAGIANQKPDEDGAIRRYPLIWSDPGITMPSIVARTVQLAGQSPISAPNEITLNWRNKNGRYHRISFSDLLKAKPEDAAISKLKDAVVVMGVSAPGIGQTKGTAVSSIEDDNEILATALDDVLSDTHLRVLPAEAILLIELVAVWLLVWVGTGGKLSSILNLAFIGFQSAAASITMLSASYTNHLIDLTTPMAFGAGVFAAVKLVQSLDSSWSRAKPGYRRVAQPEEAPTVVLLGYQDNQVDKLEAAHLQKFLEGKVGLSGVICVDDLFGGDSFVRGVCENFSCQIVRSKDESLPTLLAALQALPFHEKLNIRVIGVDLPWNPEDPAFRLAVAPHLLRQFADLMET